MTANERRAEILRILTARRHETMGRLANGYTSHPGQFTPMSLRSWLITLSKPSEDTAAA